MVARAKVAATIFWLEIIMSTRLFPYSVSFEYKSQLPVHYFMAHCRVAAAVCGLGRSFPELSSIHPRNVAACSYVLPFDQDQDLSHLSH